MGRKANPALVQFSNVSHSMEKKVVNNNETYLLSISYKPKRSNTKKAIIQPKKPNAKCPRVNRSIKWTPGLRIKCLKILSPFHFLLIILHIF